MGLLCVCVQPTIFIQVKEAIRFLHLIRCINGVGWAKLNGTNSCLNSRESHKKAHMKAFVIFQSPDISSTKNRSCCWSYTSVIKRWSFDEVHRLLRAAHLEVRIGASNKNMAVDNKIHRLESALSSNPVH